MADGDRLIIDAKEAKFMFKCTIDLINLTEKTFGHTGTRKEELEKAIAFRKKLEDFKIDKTPVGYFKEIQINGNVIEADEIKTA